MPTLQIKLANWMFRRSLYKAPRQRLPELDAAFFAAVDQRTANLLSAPEIQHLLVDELAVSNARMSAQTTAAYQLLLEQGRPQSDLLPLLKSALVEPGRQMTALVSKLMQRASRDPFKSMASIASSKQAAVYGKGFTFEYDKDGMQTYHFTMVKKCLYHEFFKANGAPELTALFCAVDDNWSDTMQDGKYGVRFDRPTTIGFGDEMCRFEFRRTKRTA